MGEFIHAIQPLIPGDWERECHQEEDRGLASGMHPLLHLDGNVIITPPSVLLDFDEEDRDDYEDESDEEEEDDISFEHEEL